MKINELSVTACSFFKEGKFDCSTELNAARNPEGRTLVTYAIANGELKILQELIAAKVDLNQKDATRKHLSALSAAIVFEQEAMVELILTQENVMIDNKCSDNMTPLIIASVLGKTAIVKKLLDMKANVNFQNDFGETALISAAAYKHEDIVKTLVTDYKADVNICAKQGQTALFHSISRGQKRTVKFLIANGATSEKMGMSLSAERGLVTGAGLPMTMLSMMAPKPAGMEKTINKKLALELCTAASKNDTARITELMKSGANVNHPHVHNGKSCSALHYACRFGHEAAAKLLIEYGADKTAKSSSGKTPLEMVESSTAREVFTTLFNETQKLDSLASSESLPTVVMFTGDRGDRKAR